jgi:hypothetical protein
MMNRMSAFHDKLLVVYESFAVENEKDVAKPPRVDFGPAPSKLQGEAQGAAK